MGSTPEIGSRFSELLLSAFSKDELWLTISFELPPVLLGVSGGGGGLDSCAASGKITMELVSIFIEASRTLKITFLNNKDAKNFKTVSAYTDSTDLIFKTFKKFIHFVTLSHFSCVSP